jgi:hypothetical protein
LAHEIKRINAKKMKGIGIIRGLTLLAAALMVHVASAQYVPSMSSGKKVKPVEKAGYWHRGNTFEHLDLSLSLGTSGIGLDLAMPVCEFAQVRVGYELMPHFKRHISADVMIGNQESLQYDEYGNRIETNYDRVRELIYSKYGYDMQPNIDMTSRITMNNFKFLVDIFPLSGNKKLHATIGFYWGPSQFAKIESDDGSTATLQAVSAYNKLYEAAVSGTGDPEIDYIKDYGTAGFPMGKIEDATIYKMTPGDKGAISIPVKTNAFKPYIGVGYEAAFSKKHEDLKFAVTGGLMFWGNTPTMVTPDGVNLTKDVSDISGDMGSYVNFVSKLKAFPVISFRFIKNIF